MERSPHNLSPSYTCVCGRSHDRPGTLALHQRSCGKTKKRLFGALEKAKDTWNAKKKRRLERPGNQSLTIEGPSTSVPDPTPTSYVGDEENVVDHEVCFSTRLAF